MLSGFSGKLFDSATALLELCIEIGHACLPGRTGRCKAVTEGADVTQHLAARVSRRARPGHLDVEPLGRIERFACGGFLVQLRRFLHPLIAFQHDHSVGVLDAGNGRPRVQLERGPVARQPRVLARALRAAEQRADLVDHLGVEGAEHDVRIGMRGRQPDRRLEGILHLRSEALRQRLADADALAVAAERVGHAVPGVCFLGRFPGALLGAVGDLEEQRQPGLLAGLEVGRVDRLGLVGDRHTRTRSGGMRLEAGLGGLLETAGVEQGPGGEDAVVLGQGLGVAGMQARPHLLQRRGVVGVGSGVVREGGPSGHRQSPGPGSGRRDRAGGPLGRLEVGQQQAQHVERAAQQGRTGALGLERLARVADVFEAEPVGQNDHHRRRHGLGVARVDAHRARRGNAVEHRLHARDLRCSTNWKWISSLRLLLSRSLRSR
jgi:hypothetical protein